MNYTIIHSRVYNNLILSLEVCSGHFHLKTIFKWIKQKTLKLSLPSGCVPNLFCFYFSDNQPAKTKTIHAAIINVLDANDSAYASKMCYTNKNFLFISTANHCKIMISYYGEMYEKPCFYMYHLHCTYTKIHVKWILCFIYQDVLLIVMWNWNAFALK